MVLILSPLILLQCKRDDASLNLEKFQHQNDTLQIIHDIIKYSGVDDVVEDKTLGSCFALESTIYPQFERLNAYATDDILVKLTKNKKPNVRAYAFWFLARRHYKDLETIYLFLKDDKAEITLKYSRQWIQTVGVFCQFVVRDNDLDNSTIKFDDATLARLHAK